MIELIFNILKIKKQNIIKLNYIIVNFDINNIINRIIRIIVLFLHHSLKPWKINLWNIAHNHSLSY